MTLNHLLMREIPLKVTETADGRFLLHIALDENNAGGGDASAANQATQITAEQAIQAGVGATADAIVAAGAAGSLSAKLRRATQGLEDLKSLIVLAAGSNHVGQVGGELVRVTGTFTRPSDTTAYAANDVVSNSASASTLITLSNALRANGGTGYIVGCRVATNKKSITPRIRVHVYNASNPTVSADNAAFQSKYADIAKRIGSFDLSAMSTGADTTNSDMSAATDWSLRIPVKAAAGDTSLYVLLETLDAFTPSSGDGWTVELLIDQN